MTSRHNHVTVRGETVKTPANPTGDAGFLNRRSCVQVAPGAQGNKQNLSPGTHDAYGDQNAYLGTEPRDPKHKLVTVGLRAVPLTRDDCNRFIIG